MCLSVRHNIWQASLERKGDTVPPWLHRYAFAVLLSKWKATTLPDKWKAILCSIMVMALSSWKTKWALHIESDQDPLTDNGKLDPWKWKAQRVGVALVVITTSGSGNAKELGSVANEIIIQVDVKLKRKSEQEKTNGWENDKQLTGHSEWHNTISTVWSGHWHKKWFCL